jgi:hypothetical protein
MARWMMVLVAVFAVIYTATVLITGEPVYLSPGAILLALVVGYSLIEHGLTRAQVARHGGDPEAAMSDSEDWAVPSTHLVPDDETAAGDTPEAHDEINPHDLPFDHPGRQAAEDQAGGAGGTTRGDR